jgi:outer membrane protein assembly factor BamB
LRRLAALVAFLAGCSGPSGPQPAEPPEIPKARDVRVLWSTSVGTAERFAFSPAVDGQSVYAAAREGAVYRIDGATGQTRWRVALQLRLSAAVGAGAGMVVVVSEEGEVVALDAETGKVRWRARASTEVLAPPAIGEGLVLVRTLDNRLFAFEAADGKRRWVYQRAPVSLLVRAPAGAVIAGELAYAGFPGGKLAAIALSNGVLRWEATVSVPKGATELERVSDVIGDPVLIGREVCAAAYRGRVGCYDALTGRQLWSRELVSLSAVSVDARYLFVADERGTLHAFDRSNGDPVWKQEALAYRQLSTPLAGEQAVVVGDFEGYIHFVARETGAFVARHETASGAVRAAPVRFGPGLVVQTEDGGVFALAL